MAKKLIYIFAPAAVLLVALGFASCEREDEEPNGASALPPKESAIYKHIADHKKERTRAGEVKLEPVVYEGDTVMYVANYGDGWEIFSNSTTMPMVLIRSDKGHFNAQMLESNPTFAAFFDMSKANLAAEMHDASAEAQPGSEEWADYGVQTANGGVMRKPAPEPLVLVGKGFGEFFYDSTNHLVNTWWLQTSPYNMYIPLLTDQSKNHALAGCGAIAVSQYLYYYHNKFGLPTTSVTSATYNASTNKYVFANPNSTIWSTMTKGDPRLTPTEYEVNGAALLIGDVANLIDTKFQKTSADTASTSSFDNLIKCINSKTNQNLKNSEFSSSTVYTLISQGKPVLAAVYKKNESIGHALLIDEVKRERIYKDYYYAPQSVVGNLDPIYVPDPIGYDALVSQYGNVITITPMMLDQTRYYFKCNWGQRDYGPGPEYIDPQIDGALMCIRPSQAGESAILYNKILIAN